ANFDIPALTRASNAITIGDISTSHIPMVSSVLPMVTASDTGTGAATAPLGSIEPPELRPVRPIGGINTAGPLTADDLEKCDDERMTKQQRDAPSRRGVVVQDTHFP